MPYVIVSDRVGEIERRPLSGAVVVGRSPTCDLVVKDILLSRTHCRLDEVDGRWTVIDLGSKNGTFVNFKKVERTALSDGQTVRVGNIRVEFFAGSIADAPAAPPKRERPVDPVEALAGTVAGFTFTPPPEDNSPALPQAAFPGAAPRVSAPRTNGPTPKPREFKNPAPGREQVMELLSAEDLTRPVKRPERSSAPSDLPSDPPKETGAGPRPRPTSPVNLTIHTDLKNGGAGWLGLRAGVRRAWRKVTGLTTRRPTAQSSRSAV